MVRNPATTSVLKIRWGHLKDGVYDFTRGKTDKELWMPLTDRLKAYLATVDKKGLAVVTDAAGRPVRYRTIADEMRKVEAKMEHPAAARYVTHGLRKNATIELYHAGCSDEMVKAVTGQSSVEMLKKYGGKVRQRELASRAQEARNLMERNKPRT
ncbi:MAG: tyrosine-type recombinase/integrase [Rhodospirillaceae bacterium]